VLVVLRTSTQAIGDAGEKPFLLVVFISRWSWLRNEMLEEPDELFPSLLPITRCRLLFTFPRLL